MSDKPYRVMLVRERGAKPYRIWIGKKGQDADTMAKVGIIAGGALRAIVQQRIDGSWLWCGEITRGDLVQHLRETRPDLVARAMEMAALGRGE